MTSSIVCNHHYCHHYVVQHNVVQCLVFRYWNIYVATYVNLSTFLVTVAASEIQQQTTVASTMADKLNDQTSQVVTPTTTPAGT